MSSRVWKVAAIVILAGVLIAMQWFQFDTSRRHSSTSFSDGPLGSSIFLGLAQKFAPLKVSLLRHAIFSQQELGGRGTLLIISSPLGELSMREAGIVRDFLESGGLLLLSCHEEACQESVVRMASELGTSYVTTENSSYLDSVAERVTLEGDDIFPPGQFAFYAARSFYYDTGKFVKRTAVGQGAVFLISSVAPISNGLIGQADNWHLAERIIRQSDRIVIDEYHHLFSERSLADLVMTPWVSLPLLGLLLAALAFFLFGEAPSSASTNATVRIPSFHRFNQDALRGMLKDKQRYKEALSKQWRVVQRLRTKVFGVAELSADESILELARKHRDLLRQKRGQKI